MMHLGNIRAALMKLPSLQNKKMAPLFYALKIQIRNVILIQRQKNYRRSYLAQLMFDEGPHQGGPYAPYFQSQREHIYQEKSTRIRKEQSYLSLFLHFRGIDLKRERQRMLKFPPRYDRTCLHRSATEVQDFLLIKRHLFGALSSIMMQQ